MTIILDNEAINLAIAAERRRIVRLLGTPDINDWQTIVKHLVTQVDANVDIASYAAWALSGDLAKRDDQHMAGAQIYLKKCEEGGDEFATHQSANGILGKAFTAHAIPVFEYAWEDDKPHNCFVGQGKATVQQEGETVTIRFQQAIPSAYVEPVAQDGMLRPDAKLADYFDTKLGGARAKEFAKVIRDRARKYWGEYQDNGSIKNLWVRWIDHERIAFPSWAELLFEALWVDTIRAQVKREASKYPALAMCVAEPVAHFFSRAQREEERSGQRILALPGDVIMRVAEDAATIGADALDALMVDKGIKLLGTVASHRVLRWQIFTAHKQVLEGNPDPRVIRVSGGWSVLAHDVLGMKSKQAPQQVEEIIEAMHATELQLPPNGRYSRLLIREVAPAVGQKRGIIRLVLGTALLPDYVRELRQELGTTHEARRAMRLVPVLELPPFVGRERDHGAQATFSMLLVAYIRNHARELVQEGGVKLDIDVLAQLAAQAGLPRSSVVAVMDRWFQDGTDGPALLKRVDGDRVTLGDAHARARDFIEKGGRNELDGAEAGKRGTAKRRDSIKRGRRGGT